MINPDRAINEDITEPENVIEENSFDVKEVESFEELFRIVGLQKEVVGSQGKYTPEIILGQMQNAIIKTKECLSALKMMPSKSLARKILHASWFIANITNTGELRQTVVKLLLQDFENDKNDTADLKENDFDTEVVKSNLEMLQKDMADFLGEESWGSPNAGYLKIDGKQLGRAGANGYADLGTGKIIVFKNHGSNDNEMKNGNVPFSFTVMHGDEYGYIILNLDEEGFSARALKNMEQTIKEYNKK